MTKPFVERRKYPRARISYRGVLETANGGKILLRARNISASGIYFNAAGPVEEFTEVRIVVALPAVGSAEPLAFTCTGVIVRVEKNEDGDWPYSAAVHFTEIDDYHREAIARYVAAVSAADEYVE